MKRCPFQNHGYRTIRKLPLKNHDRIDSHLRLSSPIDRLEMRRFMIVEIHTNHDAKEPTDFWHVPILPHSFPAPI